jgi:TolB protein
MVMKISLISIVIMVLLFHSCTFKDEWSPEDSSILFSSNRSGNSEIYIKNPDDTTWINLTKNGANDNWPALSPDEKKIVFQSTRSGKLDVWIMDKDGSNPRRLTTRPDSDYLPVFTPDGKSITFTSWRTESRDEDRAPHIYIMNADGSAQRRLVERNMGTSSSVSWHSSGSRLIFAGKTDGNSAEIFEADKNGNIINQLTNANLYSGSAEYSPDDSKIVYYQDDGTTSKIMMMNSDGTGNTVIVAEGKNYYPHWSPDGSWITYSKVVPGTNDKTIDIYAVSISDTSEQIKIVSSSFRDSEGRWLLSD